MDDAHWDGPSYARPHWGMFSVWRPLLTARCYPLSIMDPRDLGPYIKLPRVYHTEEKDHRWYYLPEQKVDKVHAIKLCDSDSHKKDGPVR